MCGIIGYTGKMQALPILLEGLAALEYRGYDSAGVALQAGGLCAVKAQGRLSSLCERLQARQDLESATCGIAHTRWATHGIPSDSNSHPHGTERVMLVHNGIIENYAELRPLLQELGYHFLSETDTECAALLIDHYYGRLGEPRAAIRAALSHLRGSFAFGICFADRPAHIYAIRRDNPLILARAAHGAFIASDIPAILPHTREYYRPDEDVLCELEHDRIRFFAPDGSECSLQSEHVDFDIDRAQKGEFPHFMLKEIHEEPQVLLRTFERFLQDGLPSFDWKQPHSIRTEKLRSIRIVACGTAMHAGLIGKQIIERLARIQVTVEIASEFRYRDPILPSDELAILLSQSGETADTIAALRHVKERGNKTLAIVNAIGSTLSREADEVIYTPAGPEIAVASTKAYSAQCAVLYLLALHLALQNGSLSQGTVCGITGNMCSQLPDAVRTVLSQSDALRRLAAQLVGAEHLFYIGRGIDCDLCTESSLKLKEISYIHSEAYAAGELKHGTISLITEGTPVVALCTQPHLADKMRSGVREVIARGATVLAFLSQSVAQGTDFPAAHRFILPDCDDLLAPFPTMCAMQLLAYHTAAQMGLDVDKPRNLAKSVTVE